MRKIGRRGFHGDRAVLRVWWWSCWGHAWPDYIACADAGADAAAFTFADRDAQNVGADAV